MITKEIFYGVKCNRCKEDFQDYNDHSFWIDENSAIEQAIESEWIEENNKHFCPNCYDYNEEEDKNIIKDEFPNHVKELKKFFDKMIYGISESIIETEDASFIVATSLYNRQKLEIFEENYIKEMLDDKFISLEYKKHERYSQFYCYVTISR